MITLNSSSIPAELMAALQHAAEMAQSLARDPEAMREACERMDQTREEIYRRHGLLDIGVPALRELRER